ncbi:MAG: tRNA (guanosine(46)-N7)-methyltransferase TrmB [Saezia sp.]
MSSDNEQTNAPSDHSIAHPRKLRSFVLRAGRTTTGQARAFEELGNKYLIPYQNKTASCPELFGRQAPLVLEIGFGMGEATAHIAKIKPDTDFIACEVHPPGVGKLMLRLEEQQEQENCVHNVRIIQHDAVEVLEHMIAPETLDGVHIFFPDPWHKKRHHKRRLIQAPFLQLLTSRLRVGGYIHCATDWQAYAEQILEVLSAEKTLTNTATDTSGYSLKPAYRPLTKFENRGQKLGHGVWDLVFNKQL